MLKKSELVSLIQIFSVYLHHDKRKGDKDMRLEEIRQIVTSEFTKKYRVNLINGGSKIVRLWNMYGCIYIVGKGKRRYGHELTSWRDHYEDWATLKLVERKGTDKVSLVRRRAKDAVKYLTQSGFWPSIKKEIEYFLENVDIEDFCKDMEKGSYENFYCQREEGQKYAWCSTYQVFESFYRKNCWKSIAWHKYDRQHESAEVEKAIKDKKDYSKRWTNGYDNSLEILFADNDYPRGWYSEEYRNCGNGHYYLLFDATHAIFYEND